MRDKNGVMGFFDGFKQRRAIKQAEKAALRDQSPLAWAKVVECLIEASELERAGEVAKRALADFPRAESTLAAWRHVQHAENDDRLRSLRNTWRSSRSSGATVALAQLYFEMGDDEQALDLVRDGLEKEPSHQGHYILLADYRVGRFKRDGLARDGIVASELYEKALDLNRDNFRLLLKAGRHYIDLGMRALAMEHCQRAMQLAPDNDQAVHLLEKARKLPASDVTEVRIAARDYELREQERRQKARRESASRGRASSLATRYQDQSDLLGQRLAPFEQLTSFERAIALPGETGQPAIVGSSPPDGAVDLVRKLFSAAEECSLEMDVSEFRRGVFEGPKGSLFLFAFDGLRLAVFCGPNVTAERVEETARRVLEHDLHL